MLLMVISYFMLGIRILRKLCTGDVLSNDWRSVEWKYRCDANDGFGDCAGEEVSFPLTSGIEG